MSIPPTLMPLIELKPLTIEKIGGVWGGTSPSEAEKNANFKLKLQNLIYSFSNILLKIHYSFPMKFWLFYYVYFSHLSIYPLW